MADRLVARNDVCVRPDVETTHPGEDRDEEDGQHREDAGRGADRTPEHDSPRAAGQLVHHPEREAAKCHAKTEEIADEIRLKELRAATAHKKADRSRDQQAGRSREHEWPLITPQLRDELVRGLLNRHHCNFPRSAAGTSLMVACALNCRARIYAAIAQRSRASTCCR